MTVYEVSHGGSDESANHDLAHCGGGGREASHGRYEMMHKMSEMR